MKDSLKTLSDEQKNSLVNFFYKSVRDGQKIELESDDRFKFIIDNIKYSISMSLFDKTKILRFRTYNMNTSRELYVDADDSVLDQSKISYITSHINNIVMNSGIGTHFSDDEFTEITGLETNISLERNKKINHLIDKIEEKVDKPKKKGIFNIWKNN